MEKILLMNWLNSSTFDKTPKIDFLITFINNLINISNLIYRVMLSFYISNVIMNKFNVRSKNSRKKYDKNIFCVLILHN